MKEKLSVSDGSKSTDANYNKNTIPVIDADDEQKKLLENGYSQVRRLFKKAVIANKFHSASWVAWAKFEQRLGNLGRSFQT